MRLTPPLPIRDDWAPDYTRRRGHANRDFAFRYSDGHGACCYLGQKVHSAVDWFAPAGTPVQAPLGGRIWDARHGTRFSGSVYGGVLGIERADGICVVMRHVEPRVALGAEVAEGEVVARVSPWSSGWPHAHVEIWRSRSGGYRHENMIDPASVDWRAAPPERESSRFYLEELPHSKGGIGPVIIGQAHGYEDTAAGRSRAAAVAAAHRARGRLTSTFRGRLRNGPVRIFALWWLDGTWVDGFPRFGPWQSVDDRNYWRDRRQENTGRTQRIFAGVASEYPWAA